MKNTLFVLFCLYAPLAFACHCARSLLDLPIEEMGWLQSSKPNPGRTSDLVFRGILVEVRMVEEWHQNSIFQEYKEPKYEMIFTLIKSYKGQERDTLRVRTNRGPEACGFGAKLQTECLIFANRSLNGYYYTAHSDCSKSVSKAAQGERFERYVRFLESISSGLDGDYIFFQPSFDPKAQGPQVLAARYSIRGGKLHGRWEVRDRKGRVLERGKYKKGQWKG